MDKAAVTVERVTNEYAIQKFTLPGVNEGCIIEYRYTYVSPNEYTPHGWRFQQAVPVIWSDYKVTIPSYFFHKVIMTGYLPLSVFETKTVPSTLTIPGLTETNAVESHYAMANAPAFRHEPYITTAADYVANITFELASITIPGEATKSFSLAWPDVDRTLLERESFGGQYKKAHYLRDVADKIKATYPATDTLRRVAAAYDYVRNTMTWNGKSSMSSDRLKKVLELKQGDAADLNFMLIGLLRDLDIDANPVILSSRDNGRISEEYALLRQFNYLVGHVTLGGKDVLLDATDRFIKPGMLPHRALNSLGRLILPDGKSRFISLLPTERDVESKAGRYTLSEDGEVKGTFSHSYGGYGAVDARASYKLLGEEKFLEDVKRKKTAWQVEKAQIRNAADLNVPMTVDYTLAIADAAQVAGDRIYLHPLLTEGESENPFKQPERQFPVDFATPYDEAYSATFILPDGYVVDELPKPLVLGLPNGGGRFTYQVQQTGNELMVVSRVLVRKAIFPAEEYVLLKEFYEKIMLKHGEQVVLKKGGAMADKK